MKLDDVAFWVLVVAAVAVILWLLSGSPTTESALISIGLFIISSEIFLWKKYFEVDKQTAISFARMKNDLNTMHTKLDNIADGLRDRR